MALLIKLPAVTTVEDVRQYLGILLMAMPIVSLCLAALLHRSLKRTFDALLYAQRQFSVGHAHYRLAQPADADTRRLYRAFNVMADLALAAHRQALERERETVLAEQALKVAHDIRSPLAALDATLASLPEIEAGKRRVIDGARERIRAIADELIKKQSEPVEVVALPKLIEDVLQDKRLERGGSDDARKLRPARLPAAAEWPAYAARVAPRQLKRVLSNLLNNALEATSAGDRVEVALARDAHGRLCLCVTDDGAGIPDDVLPKLARRGATFGKRGGSGLGLYFAKQAVERWGGSLAIESVRGQGTRVTILLPAAQAVRAASDRTDRAPPSSPIALLLDDDPWIRESWREADRRIAAYACPQELLAAAARLDPVVPIFIDVELGRDLRGDDLARQLAARGHANVFLVTGYEPERLQPVPGVKAVLGKDPPAWLLRRE
jgi:signal transduction histidine kinase